jgi:hypothetical protein
MKRYISFFLFTLLLASCSEDFLDEKSSGLIRPEDYFTSVSDLEKCVNALFSNCNLMYNETATFSFCMGGDDVTTLPGGNKGGYLQFDIFNAQDNNDRYKNMYGNAYSAIKQANVIITNIDNFVEPADNPALLQAQKDRGLGQAHFVRALAYFNLVRMCNEIPLVTTLEIDYERTKAPPKETYELIVSDLQKAEALLPVDFATASHASDLEKTSAYARPTQGSAKALLASVYLTMAGYPVKDASKYALAAQKAKEVIDNEATYGYSLLPNFADLWLFANNINSETVYGCYYSHTIGDWSDGGTWANGNMTCPQSYKPGDFGGWDDLFAELTFFREFPAGPRKDATFLTQGQNSPDEPIIQWQDFVIKHPYYKKFLDVAGYSEDNIGKYIDWWSSRSVQVIRYAEVLLVYAEAKAMSDGPDALAYTCVNRVKTRAGLPDLPAGLGATAFKDSVIMERKWEFAGNEPNARWFDMVRTETVESATAKRDPAEIPLVNQPGKDRYFAPIPEVDRVINPNL